MTTTTSQPTDLAAMHRDGAARSGLDDLAGARPKAAGRPLLKIIVIGCVLFSAAAFALGLLVSLFGQEDERRKRFVTVHFFQKGLVKSEFLVSGWDFANADGLYGKGAQSELRVPIRAEEPSDVNLTVDFSYVRRDLAVPAGSRVFQIWANNEPLAEWQLGGALSRTETLRVPRAVAGNKEALTLSMTSTPGTRTKLADGRIVLHSVMVFYD